MRGLLIAFEGLDRTGKSTQCILLKKFFLNLKQNSEIIKFPERTTDFGKSIDSFLKKQKKYDDKMIHLLFTINRWELKEQIEEKLHQNINLILDRYSYSGIAYSHAKGIDLNWCQVTEQGLPKPDIVIYLKAENMDQIKNRDGYGDEIYEKEQFQLQVKQVYENKLLQNDWYIVNACQSIEQIHQEVQKIIEKYQNKGIRNEILTIQIINNNQCKKSQILQKIFQILLKILKMKTLEKEICFQQKFKVL